MISTELYEKIEENLKNKKQTILFLNRRGYSTFVMCRDCGYTLKCKNCNIALTYHIYENKLKCHYCGYETNNIVSCPECNSKNVKYFGTGTQKLEMEVKKLFPNCSSIRMDIDTVTKKNSHENILNKFKNENIDILIGTQMVVKGHHFPNVTLVGIVAADASLNIDDYRACENTFQTIVQVAGRAGREKDKGHVIIQTYNPDNYSIVYAKMQNYDLFYKDELDLRKRLNYPPFCDIIAIKLNSEDEKEIEIASKKMYSFLTKTETYKSNKIQIFKPLPSPITKIKNKFRWRIIIKGKVSKTLVKEINLCLEEFYKLKYKNMSITVDINPNSLS